MDSVLYPPFQNHFIEALKTVDSKLCIIAPYMKLETANLLVSVVGEMNKLQSLELTIITNVSSNNFISGSSDLEALESLMSNVKHSRLVGIGNLHSKCYIFDNHIALLGSSNFTPSGFYRNLELGIKITDANQISGIKEHFLNTYIGQGTTFSLADILNIKSQLIEYFSSNKESSDNLNDSAVEQFGIIPEIRSKSVYIETDINFSSENDLYPVKVLPSLKLFSVKQQPNLANNFIQDEEWIEMFELLRSFKEKRDYWPTTLYKLSTFELEVWCDRQRELTITNKQQKYKTEKLNNIKFEYSRYGAVWGFGLDRLLLFLEIYSGEWPHLNEKYDNFEIGKWVFDSRTMKTEKKLDKIKTSILDKLNIEWDIDIAAFDSYLRLLRLYRIKKPDRWPIREENYSNGELFEWLNTLSHNLESINQLQRDKLRYLGFPLHTGYENFAEKTHWYHYYNLVFDFIKEHHRAPKYKSSYKERRLARWLHLQKPGSKLSSAQKKDLQNLYQLSKRYHAKKR